METTTYISKARSVEAVQVTAENMQEVANWCNGVITLPPAVGAADDLVERFFPAPEGERVSPIPVEKLAKAYIHVKAFRPQNTRQTEARVGDWVLQQGSNFKVFTDAAFKKSFDPKPKAPKELLKEPFRTRATPAIFAAKSDTPLFDELSQKDEAFFPNSGFITIRDRIFEGLQAGAALQMPLDVLAEKLARKLLADEQQDILRKQLSTRRREDDLRKQLSMIRPEDDPVKVRRQIIKEDLTGALTDVDVLDELPDLPRRVPGALFPPNG